LDNIIQLKKNISFDRLYGVIFFALGLFGYALHTVNYFSAIPGNTGDARFNSVILEHIFRWVMGRDGSLWNPTFFFPFEGVLAFSDNHLGSSIFYIAMRLVGLGRELAFDGWFLIGICLSYLTAYIAMRRLNLSSLGAAAGAFVFTFALPVLAKEGHAQLIYRFAIPLAFAAFWALLSSKRLLLLWQVSLWTAIQFYCSIYLGVFLIYLLASTLIVWKLFRKEKSLLSTLLFSLRNERRTPMVCAMAASIFCISAILWLLYHYYAVSLDYHFHRSWPEIASMLPRPTSYLLADSAKLSSWAGRWIDDTPMRQEHQLFFGAGVWILCIIGTVSAWRTQQYRVLGKIAALSLVLLIAMTLYVHGVSLYRLLNYIPGLNSIRAVSRIVLVMTFPVSILVAVGTEQLACVTKTTPLQYKVGILIALLIGLGAEVFAYKPDCYAIIAWTERQDALRAILPRKIPADAILFVHTRESEPFFLAELDGMILAQDLGVATLNGYSGNVPPGYTDPSPCNSHINRLNAYALHRKLPESAMAETARRVINISPTSCEEESFIANTGNISAAQAKKITIGISHVKIAQNNIEADITIHNGSPSTFNTTSLVGGPVRLSWRLVPILSSGERLSEPGWNARKELSLSIAPDASKRVDIITNVAHDGIYLFEVSLVQEGVAWFHDLGMPVAQIRIVMPKN
jgi:hypothetical protein